MKKLLIIIIIPLLTLFEGCKKGSNTTQSVTPTTGEELSESQIQILETAGIDSVSTFSDALFPDGSNISNWALSNDSGFVFVFSRLNTILSASDKKNLFIERMTKAGLLLTDDHRYSYPSQLNGLAYVWGSKTFSQPSTHPDATCQQSFYGLDCSGMIYQMAKASNLNLPSGGTENYVNSSIWNTAFTNSADFTGLEINDMLTLNVSLLQAGDIIVAPNVHIGMIFNNGTNLGILNSLGRKEYSCSKNSDKQHGPVVTRNIQVWLQQTFGSNYHVLRVKLNGSPGLTTNNINLITQTSAVTGGNITNDGGASITAKGVCFSTSPNPTISNNITTNGTGLGSFTSSLTGLTANTTYYVRAYATNSLGTGYGNQLSFTTASNTVTDIDGNIYTTVTIGIQVWMVENLKVTHYRNGDAIPNVTDSSQWINLTTGGYCNFNNDLNNVATYGHLYNWYTVNDSRKVAPVGWHVPNAVDWNVLVNYLGGYTVAGGAMKALTLWNSPNTGATNRSGFSGLPGSFRQSSGSFNNSLGALGFFWTTTPTTSTLANFFVLYFNNQQCDLSSDQYTTGFSIRCVKD